MKKRKAWFVLSILLLVLSGCSNQEVVYEIYEGNLDKIVSEIEVYETEKTLTPIEKTKTCRAERYSADLTLDVEKKTLSGTMVIDIANETEDVVNEICIRNYAASILEESGKGEASINSVSDFQTKETYEIYVKEDTSVVCVKLKESLEVNESITLCVDFTTDIPKQNDRFGYHKEGEKYSFLLTYCFPVVPMYQDGQWAEYPYISHAESNYHTAADYEVQIKVPEEYTVVATGEENTVGNTTTIIAEDIRDLAIVASNYMKVETTNAEDTEVNLYSLDYKNTEGYNEISLLAGKDSINLFEKLIGEYPYQELDIVQCFYSSAMEYPGLVLIGYPDLKTPEEIDDHTSYSSVCSQIAHEVAHQWFYGAIGSDCYVEPWLDEGFAEYCEDVLYPLSGCESVKKAAISDIERLSSLSSTSGWGCQNEEEFDEWMEIVIEQSPNEKAINCSYDIYNNMGENSYSEYVYSRGSTFLYELRKSMGDGAFFHMLQEYYKAGFMKEVTTDDFVNAVKCFDDSKEVHEIINKYIE